MTFPAPGEWQRIGSTTSVMEVPDGCVVRDIGRGDRMQINGVGDVRYLDPPMMALCFIPYRNDAMRKAMERWIRQAREAGGREG